MGGMLRANTESFQFIKPDHSAGDRGLTADHRLTLDEVLSHPFCKASGDKGQLELDICNELDVVLRSPDILNAAHTGASRLCEVAGDNGQLEPNISTQPDTGVAA